MELETTSTILPALNSAGRILAQEICWTADKTAFEYKGDGLVGRNADIRDIRQCYKMFRTIDLRDIKRVFGQDIGEKLVS